MVVARSSLSHCQSCLWDTSATFSFPVSILVAIAGGLLKKFSVVGELMACLVLARLLSSLHLPFLSVVCAAHDVREVKSLFKLSSLVNQKKALALIKSRKHVCQGYDLFRFNFVNSVCKSKHLQFTGKQKTKKKTH